MTTKALKISKKDYALLMAGQFVQEEKLYAEERTMCTIPSDDWTLVSRVVSQPGQKPWTAHEGHFDLEGKNVVVRFRSGIEPDEDENLVVAIYTATRDKVFSTGKSIEAGEERVFARN